MLLFSLVVSVNLSQVRVGLHLACRNRIDISELFKASALGKLAILHCASLAFP